VDLLNLINHYDRQTENLIPILLDYQQSKDDNCITEDEVKLIAREMQISESRIYSILTFYSLFSVKPRGKFIIQVCTDIPCYVNGSTDIIRILEDSLLIKMGETTPDGVFSLEYTSCIGCCDKSPAIRIDSETYGNLSESSLLEILTDYRRKFDENRE
jgi:NADH-quinone oxidoreductase subunit E